ncbi:unnamed protein product [Vitrella brassicaformis CCMP3155]|uniref:RxLR effector protein n=1 Tax=Vitrella brassicaformis (strain CCMP3155) TaxID=1169540 RepID=A0A0G4GY39_VITBC|nr:unnamed protein product [Vitrella brassicaformis CCMP3155]|eukprot:CEM35866.1 unnamed protein product [Vitrella brassicaformis CCMP3155]
MTPKALVLVLCAFATFTATKTHQYDNGGQASFEESSKAIEGASKQRIQLGKALLQSAINLQESANTLTVEALKAFDTAENTMGIIRGRKVYGGADEEGWAEWKEPNRYRGVSDSSWNSVSKYQVRSRGELDKTMGNYINNMPRSQYDKYYKHFIDEKTGQPKPGQFSTLKNKINYNIKHGI